MDHASQVPHYVPSSGDTAEEEELPSPVEEIAGLEEVDDE